MADTTSIKNHAAFIWSVADLLRGDYKQSEYGKVILPLTVLRRFDCVLAPVKQQMLDKHASLKGKVENFGPILDQLTEIDGLWNISRFDIPKLLDDPDHIRDNLLAYIADFSPEAREILDRFEFATQITRMHKAGLLYLVLGKFAEIDLHPDRVSNLEMGYLYEELIRRFSELSNETAGEHFTPREVIRLMVNLLFIEDDAILSKPGAKATLYDPACGTGGMLSVAEDFVRAHNPKATLHVYGQELNAETYAICRSDMMLKGQNASLYTSTSRSLRKIRRPIGLSIACASLSTATLRAAARRVSSSSTTARISVGATSPTLPVERLPCPLSTATCRGCGVCRLGTSRARCRCRR
jgi:type I restriction enzyme M protein